MTRKEWRKMNNFNPRKRKFSTAKMIPLTKPLDAWWYTSIEGEARGYVEKHHLPTGTQCGDFRIDVIGKTGAIVSFLAMYDRGIFNRYRTLIRNRATFGFDNPET